VNWKRVSKSRDKSSNNRNSSLTDSLRASYLNKSQRTVTNTSSPKKEINLSKRMNLTKKSLLVNGANLIEPIASKLKNRSLNNRSRMRKKLEYTTDAISSKKPKRCYEWESELRKSINTTQKKAPANPSIYGTNTEISARKYESFKNVRNSIKSSLKNLKIDVGLKTQTEQSGQLHQRVVSNSNLKNRYAQRKAKNSSIANMPLSRVTNMRKSNISKKSTVSRVRVSGARKSGSVRDLVKNYSQKKNEAKKPFQPSDIYGYLFKGQKDKFMQNFLKR
jgi:hypothetical protein